MKHKAITLIFLKKQLFVSILFFFILFMSVPVKAQKIDDFEISKNLEIFINLFKELHLNYVDEINPGQLTKTAIDKMLESLDPFTNFIAESDIEDIRLMTTGQYGGIGALIQQRDGYVVVSEPYENFPAFNSGIKAGDKIMEINGESALNKSVSDVSSALKGFPGSNVKVTVERPVEKKRYTFDIVREDIKIKNVPYYGMLKDGVGYVKLSNFAMGASSEIREAVSSMKTNHQISSLIIDLRGNGGGLLGEAVNIVGLFVPKNTLVVKTIGKLKEGNREYFTQANPFDLNIPIVVLIDGMSASASEIVAGSLQDLDRGVVVGQQSYGKGLVQNIVPLNYNTRLKVTIAKYYIPSGRCIQSVDYSDRDSTGKVKKNAETPKAIFYTNNKRPVYDAGGIIPDIALEPETVAKITISLVLKNLIFDYATQFAHSHQNIPEAGKFNITDNIYNDFVAFLQDKDYDYTTESEKKLEELKLITMEEKYFDHISTEYNQLILKLTHNKQEDLMTFRDEIAVILANEIVSRYYFQKGRIENSLLYDNEVNEAIQILTNTDQYRNILKEPKN
jgi:carboxyl-terminal processing protease